MRDEVRLDKVEDQEASQRPAEAASDPNQLQRSCQEVQQRSRHQQAGGECNQLRRMPKRPRLEPANRPDAGEHPNTGERGKKKSGGVGNGVSGANLCDSVR